MKKDILIAAGIDCESAIGRFLGDEEFYEKHMKGFLDETCYEAAWKAHMAKDRQGVFAAAHELKGTSGNLGMTRLYNAASELVEAIRHDASDSEYDMLFDRLKTVYADTYSAVRDWAEA